MARTVLLHVGVPKTGTSYVQDRLFRNPEALAAHGLAYPADRHDAHFLAAVDLTGLRWGGLETQAVGAWDRLVEQVRAAPGTAVISHEVFGQASRADVARAMEDLGANAGVEVHVVVSARDLVRQVPAEWQENVKHRRRVGFEEFLATIRDPDDTSILSRWFWSVQDVPDVLDRWGGTLPRSHVHVVTVPQPGGSPEVLWERFAQVLGIPPAALPESTDRANASLGVAEAELVRRLNVQLRHVLPNERYRELVRERLVHQGLARESRSPRLTLPPAQAAWAADLGREWAATIAEKGYDVVGDLADLDAGEPDVTWGPGQDPDHPDEAQVADAGVHALAAMVIEAARLRDVEDGLHAMIEDRDREIADYHATLGFRARHGVVRVAEENAAVRGVLNGWRRVRGAVRRGA
ncbi:hypothetical protein GCM10011519_22220 [Marmoricola endophyticus]|uniref:Sulfotransferase family protein n=1 Tax=Marmoricola endophyticus TaxID=2040280 RepID=A0A917BL61_9ACTN|nr:hypothetical protein [Marmoricola endophyticus]GGF47729.1 hypothetical protein GCM10011519_22220 [Marmoricola endophyticus]